MFENQPNTPAGSAPVQPRPITPPPIRPFQPAREPEDIFAGVEPVAPRTAVPAPVAPKKGGKKTVLVFLFAVIIILLVVGGVLVLVSFLRQSPITTTNSNVNLPIVNINQLENANTIANENVNLNENINSVVNENINQPSAAVLNYTVGIDADSDGLTDAEETLYGTTPTNSDTDGDTFSDGSELINQYDPAKAKGALLKDFKQIKNYVDSKLDYQVLYPAQWSVQSVDESGQEVIFQSSGDELIKISAEDNQKKASLYEWLLAKIPSADLTAYDKITTKAGFDELVSPDKLTRYLTKEGKSDKVYVISYVLGKENTANYLTTFQMMTNSFTPALIVSATKAKK